MTGSLNDQTVPRSPEQSSDWTRHLELRWQNAETIYGCTALKAHQCNLKPSLPSLHACWECRVSQDCATNFHRSVSRASMLAKLRLTMSMYDICVNVLPTTSLHDLSMASLFKRETKLRTVLLEDH